MDRDVKTHSLINGEKNTVEEDGHNSETMKFPSFTPLKVKKFLE